MDLNKAKRYGWIGILFLAALPMFLFNTWAPYHTDSAGIALRAEEILHGKIQPGWRWGTAVVEAVLGALPYFITRDRVWLHMAGAAAGIIAFLVGLYLLLVRESKDRTFAAMLTLIGALSPAVLITGTIGKEDLLAIGEILLGAAMAPAGMAPAVVAGVLFGLALASKEMSFALVYLAIVYIFTKNRKAAAVAAGTTIITLPLWLPMLEFVLSSRSVGMGKFMGFWSGYPFVLSELIKGTGAAAILVGIVALVLAIRSKRWDNTVPLLLAVLLILYLAGVSVTRYRSAAWVVPLLLLPAARQGERWMRYGIYVSLLVAFIAMFDIMPTLEFRAATNLPGSYPSGARGILERNGLILAMDSSALVRFYTDLNVKTHKPYPTEEEAAQIRKEVEELAGKMPVYIYPDYLAYDNGTLARALSDLNVTPVYTAWYRDYHAVPIYPKKEEWLNKIREAGYVYYFLSKRADSINGVSVTVETYRIITPDGRMGDVDVAVYRGVVLEGVAKVPIYMVIPSAAPP